MSGLPPIGAGRRRRWLALLAGIGLLQGGSAALASLALGRLAGHSATADAAPVLALIAVAALLLALLKQRELIVAERLGQDYAIEVRDRLFAAALAADRQSRDRAPAALLLRFVTDLNGLRQWVSRGLAVLIGDGLLLIVLLSVIAIGAPWLAAVALAGTVLLGLLMLAVRAPMAAADGALRQRRARLSSGLANRLSKSAAALDAGRERRRLRRRGSALAEAAISRARWQGVTRGAAVAIGLLTVAAMLVVAGRKSEFAEPGAMVTVIAVASLIAAPLRRLARAFELRQTWRVARSRAESLLAAPAAAAGGAAGAVLSRAAHVA